MPANRIRPSGRACKGSRIRPGNLLLERRWSGPSIRGTIHLLTADDCLNLAAVPTPSSTRSGRASRGGAGLAGVDLGPVLEWARALLGTSRSPRSAQRWASASPHDAAALAYACRNHRPCAVPPRGLLGRSHQVTVTTAEAWLGVRASPSVDDLVLRYLRAFGPATTRTLRRGRLTGSPRPRRLGAEPAMDDDAGRPCGTSRTASWPTRLPAPVRLLPSTTTCSSPMPTDRGSSTRRPAPASTPPASRPGIYRRRHPAGIVADRRRRLACCTSPPRRPGCDGRQATRLAGSCRRTIHLQCVTAV